MRFLSREREFYAAFRIGGFSGRYVELGDKDLFGLALVEDPESLAGDSVVLYFAAVAIAKYQDRGGAVGRRVSL